MKKKDSLSAALNGVMCVELCIEWLWMRGLFGDNSPSNALTNILKYSLCVSLSPWRISRTCETNSLFLWRLRLRGLTYLPRLGAILFFCHRLNSSNMINSSPIVVSTIHEQMVTVIPADFQIWNYCGLPSGRKYGHDKCLVWLTTKAACEVGKAVLVKKASIKRLSLTKPLLLQGRLVYREICVELFWYVCLGECTWMLLAAKTQGGNNYHVNKLCC